MRINPLGSNNPIRRIPPATPIKREGTLNPTDTPLSREVRERAEFLRELENVKDIEQLRAFALDAVEDALALTRVQLAELDRDQLESLIVATYERRSRILKLLSEK